MYPHDRAGTAGSPSCTAARARARASVDCIDSVSTRRVRTRERQQTVEPTAKPRLDIGTRHSRRTTPVHERIRRVRNFLAEPRRLILVIITRQISILRSPNLFTAFYLSFFFFRHLITDDTDDYYLRRGGPSFHCRHSFGLFNSDVIYK